nr:hypothetical protein [Candidatus Sigynarchaeota archaeon]
MAVIKITKKEKLDQLVARLTLQTGRKPTQQDILDAAVDLADEHFEELQEKLAPRPLLNDEKLARIMELRKKIAAIEWKAAERTDFPNDDDADIYSA